MTLGYQAMSRHQENAGGASPLPRPREHRMALSPQLSLLSNSAFLEPVSRPLGKQHVDQARTRPSHQPAQDLDTRFPCSWEMSKATWGERLETEESGLTEGIRLQ